MALDFSNIHSLNQFKKNNEKKESRDFPFERENVFDIDLPSETSIYPFFREDFALQDAMFFDTETTGLSHGAGNMVFLAGIGYVDRGKLVIKQFFVSNPSIEFKLIETLLELFANRNIVISYNGKCFDIPVIKTRCVMNGINEPDVEQIDLYHISRFVWKDKLRSFRLVDIEREILKFERKDDLPGSMAPFAYREFLLRGKTELLERVFKHNLRDVYSLFEIFKIICNKNNIDVLFAKARKFFALKEFDESLDILRHILSLEIDDINKKKVYSLAAKCLKKKGEFEKAKKLWLKIRDVESHIELAKFYEHKQRDYNKALKHTEMALSKTKEKTPLFKELLIRKKRLISKSGYFDL
ncbi:conserved hypothetical protein [Thermotomaculum hydrothermale]|uniref:YprB ribonuclease H-like domain-containing protein n=1 Tax=Thermotomaculum hydrothermale TaxID=981385 RepID=A0A7R6PYQ7_9BACT|nr:ribonuclease H-like domain-containing protein [Thermotomaculum hydrothermale]BBB32083.1 conserved hypothetical protein [Thermotomaculum hydrothermale]